MNCLSFNYAINCKNSNSYINSASNKQQDILSKKNPFQISTSNSINSSMCVLKKQRRDSRSLSCKNRMKLQRANNKFSCVINLYQNLPSSSTFSNELLSTFQSYDSELSYNYFNDFSSSNFLKSTIIENSIHTNKKIYAALNWVKNLPNRETFYKLYKPSEIIGRGNFATVFLVSSENNGQKYAVKEISKAKMNGKFHFIKNEVTILKKCMHKNICQIIDAFECQKYYFLIFEYASKSDLFETIKRIGRLNEKFSAKVIFQIASALDYLHLQKIVHRDVKPENILLNANLCAKLTDFGLACTVTGPLYRVCGTPTYVAPEILKRKGYGVEVDIWSLGVLLYVMLIGFAPFRCADRFQLFQLIIKGNISFDMPTWSKISYKAKNLIRQILTLNVQKRLTAFQIMKNNWIWYSQ